MNCRSARKNILLQLDDGLAPDLRDSLEAHLGDCADCRDFSRECSEQAGLVERTVEMRPVPDGLVERVMTHIASEPPPVPARRSTPRAWALAAAALLIASAIIFWVLRGSGPSPQPPQTTHVQAPPPDTGAQEPSVDSPRPGPTVQPDKLVDTPPPGDEDAATDPRGDRTPTSPRRDETPRDTTPEPDAGPSGRPPLSPRPYGLIASASGDATLSRDGEEDWTKAVAGDALHPGDAVKTGQDGSLVLKFAEGSTIDLAAQTELSLGEPSPDGRRPKHTRLSRGDLNVAIVPGGEDFKVETPLAEATVLGTRFSLQATRSKTELTVFEGAVALANELGRVTAREMERTVATAGHPPSPGGRCMG